MAAGFNKEPEVSDLDSTVPKKQEYETVLDETLHLLFGVVIGNFDGLGTAPPVPKPRTSLKSDQEGEQKLNETNDFVETTESSSSEEGLLPRVYQSKRLRQRVKCRQLKPAIYNVAGLSPLGTLNLLNLKDNAELYRELTRYAQNSCFIPNSAVTVHTIYSVNSSSQITQSETSTSILLWAKTNPGSVQGLAKNVPGEYKCVAFYDRMCRAIDNMPGEKDPPYRQLVLLCNVILGKVLKSDKGYYYWKTQPLTAVSGYGCVKCLGCYRPDWEDSREYQGLCIPSGKSIKSRNSSTLSQTFNEYLIFDSARVKPAYAIDVEINNN